MKKLSLIFALFGHLTSTYADFTLRVLDGEQKPVAGAALSVLLNRRNDPRSSSDRVIEQNTDANGVLFIHAADDMLLARIQVTKPGHYPADLDQRQEISDWAHGRTHTVALPAKGKSRPLHARYVTLADYTQKIPPATWVGFDLEQGQLVAPYGSGLVADFRLWLNEVQVGWLQDEEDIKALRKSFTLQEVSDVDFARRLGRWKFEWRLEFMEPDAGLVASPYYWSYCAMPMPAIAPLTGYQPKFELRIDSAAELLPADVEKGYYLRTRVKRHADGTLLSAQYSKIVGAFALQPGQLRFLYYYNPEANDRNLEFDSAHNLLQSPAGAADYEQRAFQVRGP